MVEQLVQMLLAVGKDCILRHRAKTLAEEVQLMKNYMAVEAASRAPRERQLNLEGQRGRQASEWPDFGCEPAILENLRNVSGALAGLGRETWTT